MQDDEQSTLAATRESLNETSVQILLTDANVALTFAAVAETAKSRETVERNVHNARKAYESVQRLRVRYALTDTESEALDSLLHKVRDRLEAMGERF